MWCFLGLAKAFDSVDHDNFDQIRALWFQRYNKKVD